MKENKKRIIFWGIICLISFSFGITGIISYNKGYGTKGKAKLILSPIAESFNKTDAVIKYRDLNAKVSGTKIIITYDGENGTEKYEYELKDEQNYQYLYGTYSTDTGQFVAKEMVDAVFRKDGIRQSIYDYYDFNEFKRSEVTDGVKLTDDSISINVSNNILVGLKNKITELNSRKAFKEEDLEYIVTELIANKKAAKELNGIKLYVTDDGMSYTAYITFNDDVKEGSLISLGNLIKVLKAETYNSLEIENQIPTFSDNSELYSIDTNSKLEGVNYFDENEIVCKLIIKK